MSMLETIVNAFAPGGNQGVQQRKLAMQSQQQDMEERKMAALQAQEKSDLDIHQAMLQQGYKPMVNGMVRDDFSDLPGFSAPAPSGSAIPAEAQTPSSVPPIPASFILRPGDQSRKVTLKDHTGASQDYEQPTLREQHAYLMQASQPDRAAAAEQAGNVAEQDVLGRERGMQQVRQGPAGVTLPAIPGVTEGGRFAPSEVPGVVQGTTAAAELPAKVLQARIGAASQALGAMPNQSTYAAVYNSYPPEIQQRFPPPDQYDPTKTPAQARLVSMSPEDQMKYSPMIGRKPEDWAAEIDGIAPPTGDTAALNKRLKIQVNGALSSAPGMEGLKGARAVIDKASEQIGAGENSVRTAKAEVIPKAEQAALIARAVSGGNGNAALAGVPPHLVAPATAAANKIVSEAGDAQAAANDMKTFIDMARSGNKVAYAYSPVEGVLTLNTGRGIKRVNMSEIGSYAGSGSTADKLRGWLNGHVSGATIPPDVLSDMESLHSAVAANARGSAKAKLGGVNGIYGSSFDLDKLLPVQQSAAPAMVNMKAPNGTVKPVPADQVEHYKAKGAVVVP